MIGRQVGSSSFFGTVLKQGLSQIEKKYGSIQSLIDPAAKIVLKEKQLTSESLRKLFYHEVGAIHIPGFYSSSICESLSEEILNETRINWSVSHSERGEEASDVEAVGTPHNVAVSKGPQALNDYFKTSLQNTRRWRESGSERMGPLDKLRLELDELWETGCSLSRDNKSKLPFTAGICRVMSPQLKFGSDNWTRGFAHVDELDIISSRRGLFSANIYLQQSTSGGELNLWPISVKSRWDFYRNASLLSLLVVQDAGGQALLHDVLPEPTVVRAKAGDLVLLCTQRPHSVRGPLYGQDRVSMQCFIQHEKGKPLLIES
mmetsp:Transcript_999/g.1439  ORF Transcript_999/g.1439 Transcript_999/m.1439 type:complete len:318 (-) Transcript_999:1205-2158(-)